MPAIAAVQRAVPSSDALAVPGAGQLVTAVLAAAAGGTPGFALEANINGAATAAYPDGGFHRAPQRRKAPNVPTVAVLQAMGRGLLCHVRRVPVPCESLGGR